MEKLIEVGTVVIRKSNNGELKIVDAIKTDNQFGYGIYLYRFEGKLDTGFGLYRDEFTIEGEDFYV